MNRVLVFGAGGVGAYFGGRLAQAGMEVSVICRSDFEHVRDKGFEIESGAGNMLFRPAGVYEKCTAYPGTPDYLIVTSKVLPDFDVAAHIAPAVGPGTVIVLLQNGIDIEKDIARAFPDNEIASGIAYIGVYRLGEGRIKHQAAGRLKLGNYPGGFISPQVQYLVDKFVEARVDCEAVNDIELFRWIKLVWNTPYNPVSVLSGGVDTQVISKTPELEKICENLMREICQAAAAYGKELPDDIVERNLEYTRNFPAYKTSMLLDYENKRPMEVEAIVGNVMRLAQRKGLCLPYLETTYALLRSVNKINLETPFSLPIEVVNS
ncbi:2-dehydropantoate 2-reductase [Lentisphaerota bacterium ZTH]|nr:2-dehydropantoate 2-reductase [Lentisphaerota bacterium]WET07420.1 2-dehydropantoate 2-reductase [Lentisphaerota bacterium ZTH]